eukprot:CAMPEP_0180516510 /NCGR_PEP_ID=MMETSP1036_2-20121128/53960_1 /TAXON_ID=632150 /ORGANISM="Azadinium spinosum, Strain 3D9" /LENGTH=138 /DNA_ID=CAMNT_0022528321 /DNA_START=385 /DNA_END=801 /DNA_ORIENTATION=-
MSDEDHQHEDEEERNDNQAEKDQIMEHRDHFYRGLQLVATDPHSRQHPDTGGRPQDGEPEDHRAEEHHPSGRRRIILIVAEDVPHDLLPKSLYHDKEVEKAQHPCEGLVAIIVAVQIVNPLRPDEHARRADHKENDDA